VSTDSQASESPVITRWIGRLDGPGDPLHAPEEFVLAGIDWQGPPEARIELRAAPVEPRARVELRARVEPRALIEPRARSEPRAQGRDDGWTPWMPASVPGHDSDAGETIAHAHVGEPVWTGPARALQLRSSGPVEGINVHLVTAAAVTGPPPPDGASAQAAQDLPLAGPDLPAGPGQPPIIARSAWAHGLLPRWAPLYGDVRMAFVHHSVSGNAYGPDQVPAMLRSIYVFHTYTRGWNDFGYNFAVDAYGRTWEGRAGGIDRPVVGAQAGGYNAESFGVVLLGDFSATLPTAAARTALAHLIAWKLALHGVPVRGRVTVEVDPPDAHYTHFRGGQLVSLPRVAAHRDGCTTDCPGHDMYVHGMPPLRRAVAQLTGRQHALTLKPGPAAGAGYALAPYAIAHGTKLQRASYLQLPAVTLAYGERLPLHGFLRSLAGAPLADARIALQQLGVSRHDEPVTDLGVIFTRGDGLWATVLEPSSNLLLRALHAGPPAAVSSLTLVGVAPQLTLAITPDGARLRAAGTVMPAKPRILLEVRSAVGAQRQIERMTVAAVDGVFETTLRLAPGRYLITAHSPADASNVAGASQAVFQQL